MKAAFLSLMILCSSSAFAASMTCSSERDQVTATLDGRILTVNSQIFECMEAEGDICTGMNYESIELATLIYSPEINEAILIQMPAPGAGEIKTINLQCR